jgi:ribonuclease R
MSREAAKPRTGGRAANGGRGGGRRRRAATTAPRAALIQKKGRFFVAAPLFEAGPQVALDKGGKRIGQGRIAVVEFGRGRARVIEELGSPERPRDVVEALMVDRGMSRGFVAPIETEAATAAREADGRAKRKDLTSLATFTVDPASARDFDDAVSAERTGDSLRLWIHIADVATHVKPGSALEAEAFARGNSTYVPGAVEPMLPLALSAEACSLSPGQTRLAVTAEIELSPNGEPGRASFYRSVIRSDARLSYDQLDEIFAGRTRPPRKAAAPLALAREVTATLAARKRGSALEVESREPEFSFDRDGEVTSARAVAQTEAHRLIEHLMILTNERVAELLERRRVPTLYRVHEQPDPARIELLVKQLAALGVPTPPVPKRLSPTQAGELAAEASRLVVSEARRRGHGQEAYTSLVLRSLKQASYSERNLGHAGLGSPAYLHFTSPIRRYPDLIAHRALLSAIGAGEEAPDRDHVRDAALHSSEREREAMRVERDADDVCAAFLLRRELFESGWERGLEGEVVGVIGAGAFVRFGGRLADIYEGFLPARVLGAERYDLDDTETALVGRRTGTAVRLGDPVTVRVDSIDAVRGRVDLLPHTGEAEPARASRGRGRAGGKGGRR